MSTRPAFTPPPRPRPGAALLGLAAGLLSLGLPAARAQTGTPGTPGTTGLVLPGSFTFSDPNATFQGTNGGDGGPGTNAGPTVFSPGQGGAGGVGGVGLIASGTNADITILNGTFAGGHGGTGGMGGFGKSGPNGPGGIGGDGGDAFDATGAGTNITILGGEFEGGPGGNNGSGAGINGGIGGDDGNDFSTSAGETASVYGGFFQFHYGAPPNRLPGAAFALNGSHVTVYGTFQTFNGAFGPVITAPQTFTTSGTLFGTLADNTGSGQEYLFTIANGGTLTVAPSPVPESSTTVSLGLLLALGLGGLVVTARRKKSVP